MNLIGIYICKSIKKEFKFDMPAKGKGKGKKKGKKGGGLGADPDEYKSMNVAQRQILQQLFEKMRRN